MAHGNGLSRMHGGPDQEGVPRHDFSTNANACGPCPVALSAVAGADATRYPDPAYAALRERLAAFHGVSSARVVVAASASEFIWRVTAWVRANGGRRVRVPRHAYGDYAVAARGLGLAVTAESDDADLAWGCDPSSPLGDSDTALERANAATTVLDLAYAPLRLAGPAPGSERHRQAWQLWSPNKALGLTGIRGAYAIAPEGAEGAVRGLDALAASWPLGAHGEAMLQAWCDPHTQAWLAGSLQTLRGWRDRQLALCESMGWTPRPGGANFHTALPVVTGRRDQDIARVLHGLRTHGVKLRDCASFGLPGHVRLGVLAPASQDALRQAWEARA